MLRSTKCVSIVSENWWLCVYVGLFGGSLVIEWGAHGIFINARIRRMGEGNIFSLCVSSHRRGGGGLPPSQVQVGGWGYPFPGPGGGAGARQGQGPTSQVQVGAGAWCGWGYPFPRSRWGWGGGIPSQVQVGGGVGSEARSPLQVRSQDGGGGGTPYQHSVYLLRDGRYASCVHARGLCCDK